MKYIQKVLVLTILTVTYLNGSCNYVNGKMYGDCSGVTINSKARGGLIIKSHKSESGIISGAKVYSGGNLFLSGISNGDIIVYKNAKLFVTGVVSGAIYNNGGEVLIDGDVNIVIANKGTTTISGVVDSLSGKGKIIYRKGAVIAGEPKFKE